MSVAAAVKEHLLPPGGATVATPWFKVEVLDMNVKNEVYSYLPGPAALPDGVAVLGHVDVKTHVLKWCVANAVKRSGRRCYVKQSNWLVAEGTVHKLYRKFGMPLVRIELDATDVYFGGACVHRPMLQLSRRHRVDSTRIAAAGAV